MILTVDSSTNIASVTLSKDGVILHTLILDDGKTHSQKLMPLIDKCLIEADCSLKDIDAFAAVAGPGSFTGLRIGIATIQGLAYATNKPCISINNLDAMAFGVEGFKGFIVPLIDARNAQAYSAVYDAQYDMKKVFHDRAGSVAELAEKISLLKTDTLFVGDGAHAYINIIIDAMDKSAHFYKGDKNYTTAKGAAKIAFSQFASGKVISPAEFTPYYIRNTSAKKRF